jgi:hypothetical protein
MPLRNVDGEDERMSLLAPHPTTIGKRRQNRRDHFPRCAAQRRAGVRPTAGAGAEDAVDHQVGSPGQPRGLFRVLPVGAGLERRGESGIVHSGAGADDGDIRATVREFRAGVQGVRAVVAGADEEQDAPVADGGHDLASETGRGHRHQRHPGRQVRCLRGANLLCRISVERLTGHDLHSSTGILSRCGNIRGRDTLRPL